MRPKELKERTEERADLQGPPPQGWGLDFVTELAQPLR